MRRKMQNRLRCKKAFPLNNKDNRNNDEKRLSRIQFVVGGVCFYCLMPAMSSDVTAAPDVTPASS